MMVEVRYSWAGRRWPAAVRLVDNGPGRPQTALLLLRADADPARVGRLILDLIAAERKDAVS